MKRVISLAMVMFSVVIAGCISVVQTDRRVVVSEELASDIHVIDVKCGKTNSDYCMVQANVKNRTSSELCVQWKTVWFDANGIEIDSITSTWNDYAIQPGDIKVLKHTAPSLNAVDARIYIRSMRY